MTEEQFIKLRLLVTTLADVTKEIAVELDGDVIDFSRVRQLRMQERLLRTEARRLWNPLEQPRK
jgi:hypothetical protein